MTGELHEGSRWLSDGIGVIAGDGEVVKLEGTGTGALLVAPYLGLDGMDLLIHPEDAHAVLERGGCCPHASGPRLTDEEFRALMALMMVEDSLTVLTEEKAILVATMNREAKARGYSDWIAAYHADWKSKGFAGAGLAQPTAPKAITDVEFEAHVRAQGFKPSPEQLGFMRAGFELPGRPALPSEAELQSKLAGAEHALADMSATVERALAEVRVAVAQLLELRCGEMSAKESELLDAIRERVKP